MNDIRQRLEWIKVVCGCCAFGMTYGILPGQAATLSSSSTIFAFEDFSSPALSVETFTDTQTFTLADGGEAVAEADANAVFFNDPAQGGNFVSAEVLTDGISAFGLAEGEASLIGNFAVNAGEIFSFDFATTIDLLATVDDPSQEIATARSSALFEVVDITDPSAPLLLDVFEVNAGISTKSGGDFFTLDTDNQQYLSINQPLSFANLDVEGLTQGVQSQVVGTYHRLFPETTLISLQEFKMGSATGEVLNSDTTKIPEPLTVLASMLTLGFGLLIRKELRQ